MDNLKKYISNFVDAIVENFQGVSVRYQYFSTSETHLLEVTPESVFESAGFQRVMNDMLVEFYGLFPNESVVFVTDNALVEITSPEIVKTNAKKEVRPLTIITSNPAPGIPAGYIALEEVSNWTITLQDNILIKKGKAANFKVNLTTSFNVADIELFQSMPKTQFVDVWTAGYTFEPAEENLATVWISHLWRSKHRSTTPKDRSNLLTYATAA